MSSLSGPEAAWRKTPRKWVGPRGQVLATATALVADAERGDTESAWAAIGWVASDIERDRPVPPPLLKWVGRAFALMYAAVPRRGNSAGLALGLSRGRGRRPSIALEGRNMRIVALVAQIHQADPKRWPLNVRKACNAFETAATVLGRVNAAPKGESLTADGVRGIWQTARQK